MKDENGFLKYVFISQPLRGREWEEIVNERKGVSKMLNENDFAPVNSIIEKPASMDTKGYLVYQLAEAVKTMSVADYVYFCDGWEDSRGCQIEFEICEKYDIPVLFKEDLERGEEK